MIRLSLALAFTFCAVTGAAADDTLIFKDPNQEGGEKEVRIVSLNFKSVSYTDRRGIPNKVDSKDLLEIHPDTNKKTYDFAQADTSMGNGSYVKAAARFQNVMRDPRASSLLKQLSGINTVKCYYKLGNYSGALGAIQGLRRAAPSSFYLRESYEMEIKCHIAKGDMNAADKAIGAFASRGSSEGMSDWKKGAELMRAGLYERKGNWTGALRIHSKYARDREVGVNATLGEIRCLTELGKWSQLGSRASSIIGSQKSKKRKNYNLLMAAHNAKGELSLNNKKYKDALLSFMLGVAVFSKGTGASAEHEAAIGRAVVACAKYAGAQTDAAKKSKYRQRALDLLAELKGRYPGSRHQPKAEKAVQGAK